MRQFYNVLVLLFAAAILSGVSFGQMNGYEKQGKVRAPELTGGKGWLNTDKPLSVAGLKGKVVLLDFWTYGCINCIHIIPDLKKLEAKYPNNLVVIGVHSAKFDNEKTPPTFAKSSFATASNIRLSTTPDFKIWEAYAIRAWPGLVVIDPDGYVIKTVFGEGHYDELDRTIAETITDFRKKGSVKRTAVEVCARTGENRRFAARVSGKVLADEKSKRLFIADSNHNRIVVTDFAGKLLDVIGSGKAAAGDGDFARASFNRPQGLALDGETLYVADTENHLIRRVDLKTKRVRDNRRHWKARRL
jgi:thiol-disulfide isomerase/thioredoxin